MLLVVRSACKALATVIGDRSGTSPSFAYLIGDYTLDHPGTLASPKNDYLIRTLIDDGHREKEIQIIPDKVGYECPLNQITAMQNLLSDGRYYNSVVNRYAEYSEL